MFDFLKGAPKEAIRGEETKEVKKALNHLLDLNRSPRHNIGIVGETILDGFQNVTHHGYDREGGDAYHYDGYSVHNLGGAGNVVRSVVPFARSVTYIGALGGLDPETQIIKGLFEELGDRVRPMIYEGPNIATPHKKRFLIGEKQSATFSTRHTPISGGAEQWIKMAVGQVSSGADAFIVCDYGRGLITKAVAQSAKGQRILIDPRSSVDTYNVHGAWIKPNMQCASEMSGVDLQHSRPDELTQDSQTAADRILARYNHIDSVCITLEDRGAFFMRRGLTAGTAIEPIFSARLNNPSGAGDIVQSVLALLNSTFHPVTAIRTGIACATTSVEHPGTTALSPELIRETMSRLR